MLDRSLTLFRPFGFFVSVHWTWLLLGFLVTSSLATGWFPSLVPGAEPAAYWIAGILGATGLFLSILIHELCHAFVGRAYQMPIERITLFLFGGVAQLGDEPPSPQAEFQMSIAGPAASVVLAFLFWSLHLASAALGAPALLTAALSYLASINVVVAVFNMLPGFPLDGGRCLRAALWQWKHDLVWATRIASRFGQVFGVTFLLLGFYSLLGQGFAGLWFIVLGFLLIGLARSSYVQLVIKESLHGQPAEAFMNWATLTVRPETRLSDLMRGLRNQEDQSVLPVINQHNQFIGCVNLSAARSFPQEEWPIHKVSEITEPCTKEHRITPDVDAEAAFSTMVKNGYRELLVVQGDRLLGILNHASLASASTDRQ